MQKKFFEDNWDLYFSPNPKNDFLGNLDHILEQLHSLFIGYNIIGSISIYDQEQANRIKECLFSEAMDSLRETVQIVIAERQKAVTPQNAVKGAMKTAPEPKDLKSPEEDLNKEGAEQSVQ